MNATRINSESALDMLLAAEDKGGMSEMEIALHKQVCGDINDMQEQINIIRSDMSELKKSYEEQNRKIDEQSKMMQEILTEIKRRPTISEIIARLCTNKVFLAVVSAIIAIIVGKDHLSVLLTFFGG